MNIFLSYSSTRRDIADRLRLALEAEDHEVFFDRSDLAAGENFQQPIRDALAAADLFIFLISPESVASGSFTLAELDMAQQQWRRPARRVLPVVVAATPKSSIPAYLKAVTLLEPQGDVVAQTLTAVAALARPWQVRWRWALRVAALLLLGALAWWGSQRWQARQLAAAEQTARRQQLEQAGRALALCHSGSRADGFAQLTQLAAAPPVAAGVLRAREDCAMAWLREPRGLPGDKPFAQFTVPLRAVLAQALVAGATGARAADLRAHLGWADALLWHDNPSPAQDPGEHYHQALQDDADNFYAHALWGHWLFKRTPADPVQAKAHFAAALKNGRDLPFLRTLQVGVTVRSLADAPYALQVLNQMRVQGEPSPTVRIPDLWDFIFGTVYLEDTARLLRQTLPAQDTLQVFLWLYPQPEDDATRRDLWRLAHGWLLIHAGRAGQARPDLLLLQKELRAADKSGPAVNALNRLLAKS